ncbi:hypothetical protein DBR44_16370 [Aquitalea sp. FJL05]|uniref:hypothetical protein n=1 Tax=Aquitalea sp. FJL05 TaxID=2153366 RepID=UPI000F5A235C|nr:hypothetical protein [Aquitalea sp. FJL05]RQO68248.1 hypothetical protein DBR44_16370 [Aquitalea sp. FJL05]
MAAQSVTPPLSPDHPAIRDLRHAVELMDCLSQEGFGQIAAIARCAEVYLGHGPEALQRETVATVLRAICGKADDIQNCINVQADEVGCACHAVQDAPASPLSTAMED